MHFTGGHIFSPLSLGPPSCKCRYCGACFWYEERVDRHRHTSSPSYSRFCRGGSVILPSYKPPPEPLHSLLTGANRSLSAHFFDNIRYYNSMFAFTSMGIKVIDSINDGRGPYVFKVSGQLCHRIGSLLPKQGQLAADRPDIVDRVFHMKLTLFMDDIVKNKFFGPITAVVYTIEFQKSGLSHVHIILWIEKTCPLTTEQIDRYISAQLPNPSVDQIGYEVVSTFMMHGPCGDANPECACMVAGECSKFYPKEYCYKTIIL